MERVVSIRMECSEKVAEGSAVYGRNQDEDMPGMSTVDPEGEYLRSVRMPDERKGSQSSQPVRNETARTKKMARYHNTDPAKSHLMTFATENIGKQEVYCFKCGKHHRPKIQFHVYLN